MLHSPGPARNQPSAPCPHNSALQRIDRARALKDNLFEFIQAQEDKICILEQQLELEKQKNNRLEKKNGELDENIAWLLGKQLRIGEILVENQGENKGSDKVQGLGEGEVSETGSKKGLKSGKEGACER
jgi:hypothetical protein